MEALADAIVENECGGMVGWGAFLSRASVWGRPKAICVSTKNPNQAEAGGRGEEAMLYLPIMKILSNAYGSKLPLVVLR